MDRGRFGVTFFWCLKQRKDGVTFPLKKRYDESNITLEGVEESVKQSDPYLPREDAPHATDDGPEFGASDDWLKPFVPSAESGARPDEETPNGTALRCLAETMGLSVINTLFDAGKTWCSRRAGTELK